MENDAFRMQNGERKVAISGAPIDAQGCGLSPAEFGSEHGNHPLASFSIGGQCLSGLLLIQLSNLGLISPAGDPATWLSLRASLFGRRGDLSSAPPTVRFVRFILSCHGSGGVSHCLYSSLLFALIDDCSNELLSRHTTNCFRGQRVSMPPCIQAIQSRRTG